MILRGLKIVVLGLLLACTKLQINAQISSGGIPSIDIEVSDNLIASKKELNYLPSQAQLKGVQSINKGESLKFAHQFSVNYTPENSGEWSVLEDGTRIWRLLISSEGAYSINLIFDRFVLPKGAKLFVYNTDHSDIKGAYTSNNNQPSGMLAISPVQGDQVIVEYQQPGEIKKNAEILIGAVNHDYLDIQNLKHSRYFGEADQSCDVDISCYDTDNIVDVKRAVVKLIIDGTELCTGTLINNTEEDKKAYIITAAHCLREDNTAGSVLAYFNYEIPYCSDILEGYDGHTLSGGQAKVYVEDLDIALVEMNNIPPAHYRPYWAGWSLNASPSKPFKAIHHPWGDVKKIATFDGQLQASTFNVLSNAPYAQVDNFHWRISEWTTYTTEPGSSGGPLFDANDLFVGSLSGGDAYCNSPYNDFYTQFYKAWDMRSGENEHFKPYLDPSSSGVQSLAGKDLYEEEEFIRLTNVEFGDKPTKSSIAEGGFLAGHNATKSTAFAEKFSGIKSATIKGVYIAPGKVNWGSNQTFNLAVWQGSQKPEVLKARKEGIKLMELGVAKRDSNEVKYYEFDTPVDVIGNFFVGYEINYDETPTDTLAMYYSAHSDKSNNSMLVYKTSDGWSYASDLYGDGNYSLWIDVLAELVVYGDTQIAPEKDTNLDVFPVPIRGDEFYINSKQEFIKNYQIFDYAGRMVESGSINLSGGKLPIKINNLPKGIYVLKLELDDRRVIRKIIVE